MTADPDFAVIGARQDGSPIYASTHGFHKPCEGCGVIMWGIIQEFDTLAPRRTCPACGGKTIPPEDRV